MSGTERAAPAAPLSAPPAEAAEAVVAVDDRRADGEKAENGSHGPPLQENSDGANWPDESVESAFLAEARQRGETLPPKRAEADVTEEADPKSLPSLDELVQRIPAEVRETLDELFRARFVTVKRVPKKALKT